MKQDRPGARKLLEEAISWDSRLLPLAQMVLANIYEQDGGHPAVAFRMKKRPQEFAVLPFSGHRFEINFRFIYNSSWPDAGLKP